MNNPTPEQVKEYLEKRNCKLKLDKQAYIMFNGEKYTSILKDREIDDDYLEKILSPFGISIEEFKQDWNDKR